MYLVKAGRRTLNLEYLIMSEEGETGSPIPPGCVRVTMTAGKEFDLTGPDADEFRRASRPAVKTGRAPSGQGHATMAVRVNPANPDEPEAEAVPVPTAKGKKRS